MIFSGAGADESHAFAPHPTMTKPARLKAREGEFAVARELGVITHTPTAVVYRAEPLTDADLAELRTVLGRPGCELWHALAHVGAAWPPKRRQRLALYAPCRILAMQGTCSDLRSPASVPPGHANPLGVRTWALWVDVATLKQAVWAWGASHSPAVVADMEQALSRRAGQAWIYTARLDRERPPVQKL